MEPDTAILRPGLLDGLTVLAAPAGGATAACAAAGARVLALEADPLDEAAVEAAAPACDVVVADAAVAFGAGGPEALRAALDGTWCAVRAVVARRFVEAQRPGKVVLVAPRASAGPHAGALRAGLENLARTTSIEWARYAVTTTAILPGERTGDEEVAEVVAYLASPAGDYFSGAALSLD